MTDENKPKENPPRGEDQRSKPYVYGTADKRAEAARLAEEAKKAKR